MLRMMLIASCHQSSVVNWTRTGSAESVVLNLALKNRAACRLMAGQMDVKMQAETDLFNDWLFELCEREEVSMECAQECWKMPQDQRRWLMKFPEERRKCLLPGYAPARQEVC